MRFKEFEYGKMADAMLDAINRKITNRMKEEREEEMALRQKRAKEYQEFMELDNEFSCGSRYLSRLARY